MKGIILKDFYENYIIRKNLINWILGIIMLIVVVAVFRTKLCFRPLLRTRSAASWNFHAAVFHGTG